MHRYNFNLYLTFIGIDAWVKLHARLLALILEFNRTPEACKKKFSFIFKQYKVDKTSNNVSGERRHEYKFMTQSNNGDIKLALWWSMCLHLQMTIIFHKMIVNYPMTINKVSNKYGLSFMIMSKIQEWPTRYQKLENKIYRLTMWIYVQHHEIWARILRSALLRLKNSLSSNPIYNSKTMKILGLLPIRNCLEEILKTS